jgi:hypothetical protein
VTDRDWDAETAAAVHDVDDSDEEEGMDLSAPPPPVDPVTVVVIGSADWSQHAVIGSVLQEWWENAGHPPVQLVTSGCPTGAEATARMLYPNWHNVTIRDEGLTELHDVLVFAFIRDHSAGATAALKALRRHHPWERVIRDDISRNVSPWASR